MPGPAAGLIVGGAVKVLGGIFGASAAKREARRREAQARALEHQKSLIRATNSGISAIISKNGEIIQKQGFFELKTLKGKVKIHEGRTLFSITGNYLLAAYIILMFMYLFYYNRTNVIIRNES